MHKYLMLLCFVFSHLCFSVQLNNDTPKPYIVPKTNIEESLAEKRKKSLNVVASGTVNFDCKLKNISDLYSLIEGEKAAKRDFISGHFRWYGLPNGIGPVYPGNSCEPFSQHERVIIWPTQGCENELSYNQASEFAESYNNQLYKLVCAKQRSNKVVCKALLNKIDMHQRWSEKTDSGWDDYALPVAQFQLYESDLCINRLVKIVFKNDSALLKKFKKNEQYTISFPVNFLANRYSSIEASDVLFSL